MNGDVIEDYGDWRLVEWNGKEVPVAAYMWPARYPELRWRVEALMNWATEDRGR